MNLLRRNTQSDDVANLIGDLKEIDYALIALVDRTRCLNVATAGDLVQMQRRLRRLRYRIETENGQRALRSAEMYTGLVRGKALGPSRPTLHAGNSHPVSCTSLNYMKSLNLT